MFVYHYKKTKIKSWHSWLHFIDKCMPFNSANSHIEEVTTYTSQSNSDTGYIQMWYNIQQLIGGISLFSSEWSWLYSAAALCFCTKVGTEIKNTWEIKRSLLSSIWTNFPFKLKPVWCFWLHVAHNKMS